MRKAPKLRFRALFDKVRPNFIDELVRPIRNEIAHVNAFGTSMGALAEFDTQHRLVSIKSDLQDKQGRRIDLQTSGNWAFPRTARIFCDGSANIKNCRPPERSAWMEVNETTAASFFLESR